mgnify:FL=1|tara:strand:- start:1913 stop:2476 length:564 start_codon:yes stop_codon:yes gene_type:complete
MNFNTEWENILENLGGEVEIREMAREQGFLGWRQGVIQPIIGFDKTWMDKPEIVGLGIIVPSAIMCMSRDLEDFDQADIAPVGYLNTYDSLSELLLAERKALLALEPDIKEAQETGWLDILAKVKIFERSNNIEDFELKRIEDPNPEAVTEFISKIYEMLQDLQVDSNIVMDESEVGFTDEFQNKWV